MIRPFFFRTPLLFFFSIATLADILGFVVNGFLFFVLSSLVATISTGVGAGVVGVAGIVLYFVESNLVNLGVVEGLTFFAGLLLCAQFLISLVTIIIFYSIVLSSPKGSFSFFDITVALLVFLLESLPVVGGLPLWSLFALFLRRRFLVRSLSHREGSET